jgi:UrcA family protein
MIRFSRTSALCNRLAAAVALGALAFISAGAQAAAPDEITISKPTVNTVGRDEATLAPIEEVSEKASVKFDPVTLTTNSGVALLNDSVLEAAAKVCNSVTFTMADDDTDGCIRRAVKSAQAQVDQAVARARSAANG